MLLQALVRATSRAPLRRLMTTASPSYVSVPFFQLDSFSAMPYGGNPAAVLLLPYGLTLSDVTMKAIAAENNLSETCFVAPRSADSADSFSTGTEFNLRWFTPQKEVALCGHGTLATAGALFAPEIGNSNQALTFHTLSGPLTAAQLEEKCRGAGVGGSSAVGDREVTDPESTTLPSIELDFPMNVPTVVSEGDLRYPTCQAIAAHLLESTGAHRAFRVKRLAHCTVTKKLLVHLQLNRSVDEQHRREILVAERGTDGGNAASNGNVANHEGEQDEEGKTALAALAALPTPDSAALLNVHPKGEIVTGVSLVVVGTGGSNISDRSNGYIFVSRYFSPWNGIPEDPVNGSSHTLLAPYWARFEMAANVAADEGTEGAGAAEPQHLSGKQGPVPLLARQASPRGGKLALVADFEAQRVKIAGPAAVTIVGMMRVPMKMA